jgi:hypothetical protein
MSSSSTFEEFLYMNPETGELVCMISDGDGFRPASAGEEMRSVQLTEVYRAFDPQSPLSRAPTASAHSATDEEASLDDFVTHYEQAYGVPAMA